MTKSDNLRFLAVFCSLLLGRRVRDRQPHRADGA